MSGPPMPDGFWSEISDVELSRLISYAEGRHCEDRQVPLSELVEEGDQSD